MTKYTNLVGTENDKKKVEIVKQFGSINCEDWELNLYNGEDKIPTDYDNVELLAKSFEDTDMDLMFLSNKGKRDTGYLCLGHWNGGC